MSKPIQSFKDLIAWQRAFSIGCDVHRLLSCFPRHEMFGLTNQVRRSSTSVASNIAEGYGRGTTDDYLRFLRIARGSLFELDTQLMFAANFEYLNTTQYDAISSKVNESSRVLQGLIRSLEPHSH